MTSRYRIGFDIGGTFTDFILLDAERSDIRLHKCLTTPDDPSVGALQGLSELLDGAGLTLADISEIVHGTTLVTNALIERRGARLGLITTQGFGDILEMGTEQRYDIYDLFLKFPDPLVPRRRRIGVAERMDRDGNAVIALDSCAGGGRGGAARCGWLRRHRDLLPARLPQPRARAGSRGGNPRALPRSRAVAVVGRGGRVVGISALRHHLRQRLCAAADGPLSGPAGTGTACGRTGRAAAADAFRGRTDQPTDGACLSDPPAGKRPRRRRSGDGVFWSAGRAPQRHQLRHGRHDGQGLPDRGRPRRDRGRDGGGARAPLQDAAPACRSRRR